MADESATQDPLAITADVVDDLVKKIRAGAMVGLVLFALTALQWFILVRTGSPDLTPAFRLLMAGELMVYSACALAIYRLSRVGVVTLLGFCLFKSVLATWYFSWVGPIAGVLLLLVLLRSAKSAFHFYELLRAARARRMVAAAANDERSPG
jgi:hypothetical protein